MKNKKVFISRMFSKAGAELLKEAGFSVTIWDKDRPMTQDELIEKTKRYDVLFCALYDKIDKRFLNECSHLEMISQFGAGYDNVDVSEATKLGIPVTNTPGALTEATADIAFGLMIAVSRKMFYMHKKIIDGKWSYFRPQADLGIELKNKTLGIFGMGRIGLKMAERCKGAYNMKIIYHNRKPNPKADEINAEYADFPDMLKKSDIISLHCALTEETKGIFNKSAFSQMKTSSIFINTARGQVHNETDLIEALKTGIIWGAGLDVTNPEPMHPDNPLLQMENVAILPHIGSSTIEARTEMSRMAAENIVEYYKNKRVPHLVNPEVLKK
jgi:glyoxylate reductase